jgi:hypothetical protein
VHPHAHAEAAAPRVDGETRGPTTAR